MPSMRGFRMRHVVTSGQCWLEVDGIPNRLLQAGDLALVPRGAPSEPLFSSPAIRDSQGCPSVRQRGWKSSRFQSAVHPESLRCKELHIDPRLQKRRLTNRTRATGTWLQFVAPLHAKLAKSALTGVDETWSTNIALRRHHSWALRNGAVQR